MRSVAYLAALLALVACSGGSSDDGTEAGCASDARAQMYVAGLEQASDAGMFKARWVEGTPAPPDRGNNTWKLEILDPNGSPMAGVSRVRVKAWMPDHGHGTNPLWNDATGAGGTYEVGPFNLFMPGLWQFTVSVETQSQTDSALVAFCVEG
jgi:hypothetical protein